MTVSLLEAALGIQFKQPVADRPRVIRIPARVPLTPEEAAQRQVREAFDQAQRKREELQVLATLERLFPGQAIPARYQGAHSDV